LHLETCELLDVFGQNGPWVWVHHGGKDFFDVDPNSLDDKFEYLGEL